METRERMERLQNGGGQDKKSWDLKQYVVIALVIFVTFCCCTLFFFLIYRYNGFTSFWRNLIRILQPIIIGLVLAYLLNPIMRFQEQFYIKFLEARMKNHAKAKKTARGVAIIGSLAFLVGIFVLLIAAIVPAVIASIQSMAATLPDEVNNLIAWVNEFTKGDTEAAEVARQAIERASTAIQNFLEDDILTKVRAYLSSITSGVIYGVKFLINVLVGIIISVYVMASKETFAGQAKKIIYALFKPVRANVIVETVRKSNDIFGGFISGKLLDSAIIGVLTYIVLAIMKMPDIVLVSVIIGVTNVIPFFGPFIGAIPSFIIIVLQDPVQGLYFLIFVVILQQVDGNIIGPKILGDSTGLSSFWVVFAILVFGGLWGFTGMLLGVPIMAVIYYIIEKSVGYFLRKRGLAEDTEKYVYLTGVDRNTNELVYDKKKQTKDAEPECEDISGPKEKK